MLFDTHTHIDQAEFDACRPEIVQRARAAGVTQLIAVGCSVAESEKCLAIAREYTGVYAAVGIQPNYVAQAQASDWSRIEQLAGEPGVVAIGETGLDRYWDHTPFPDQQDYFERHIQLAAKRELPFIVHMRDCEAEILEMLRAAHQQCGKLQGVMHSFTGDATLAAACVELDLHISFAGMLTFKNAAPLRDCARIIPLDRLLIETDSPYLSPVPVRGKRPNEPSYLPHTAACLAELRGLSLEQLAQQTTANAERLFGLQ